MMQPKPKKSTAPKKPVQKKKSNSPVDMYKNMVDPATGKLIGRSKTSGEVNTLRVIENQLYVSTRKGDLSIWQNR